MNKLLLAASLVLLPTLAGAGSIYRWVDARGGVHYTQYPPGNGNYERFTPGPGVTTGESPNQEQVTQLLDETEEARLLRLEQEAESQKAATVRRDRCRSAQERIAKLATRPPVRWATRDKQGNVARMTEEQYAKEMNESRTRMEQNCERSSGAAPPEPAPQ